MIRTATAEQRAQVDRFLADAVAALLQGAAAANRMRSALRLGDAFEYVAAAAELTSHMDAMRHAFHSINHLRAGEAAVTPAPGGLIH